MINYKPGNGPIIKQRTIQSISELRPFFHIASASNFIHSSSQSGSAANPSSVSQHQTISNPHTANSMKQFENSVHEDFLDGYIEWEVYFKRTRKIKKRCCFFFHFTRFFSKGLYNLAKRIFQFYFCRLNRNRLIYFIFVLAAFFISKPVKI
jgi:hypothetical protein